MKYEYPNYKLKMDFTPGTYSENNWKYGETACVDSAFYSIPDGSEYAIFKFSERTMTGRKKNRWEVWQDGRFSNNYFTCFDDAAKRIDNEIMFCELKGTRQDYRVFE